MSAYDVYSRIAKHRKRTNERTSVVIYSFVRLILGDPGEDSGVKKTEVCWQALENGSPIEKKESAIFRRAFSRLPSRLRKQTEKIRRGLNSRRKTIFSPPLYVPGLRGCDWLGVMAWFLEFGFETYLVDVRKLLVFKLVLNFL